MLATALLAAKENCVSTWQQFTLKMDRLKSHSKVSWQAMSLTSQVNIQELIVALGDKMQILDFDYTHLDLGSLGQ